VFPRYLYHGAFSNCSIDDVYSKLRFIDDILIVLKYEDVKVVVEYDEYDSIMKRSISNERRSIVRCIGMFYIL